MLTPARTSACHLGVVFEMMQRLVNEEAAKATKKKEEWRRLMNEEEWRRLMNEEESGIIEAAEVMSKEIKMK